MKFVIYGMMLKSVSRISLMFWLFLTSRMIRMILKARTTVAAVEKLAPAESRFRMRPTSVAMTTNASKMFQESSKYYLCPSPISFMIISALKMKAKT